MALISVVIPAYNASRYLAECLDSIIRQTLNDWEIILVDDGSTDNTKAIGERYRALHQHRMRLLATPNKGVAAARNAGIAAATGKYIAFCDADDAYLPDAFARMARVLERNSQCDIAVGGFINSATPPARYTSAAKWTIEDAATCLRNTLYQKTAYHCSAWAKLYRASLFRGTTFAHLRYEDLEITPRLYLKCRQIAVSTAPVYFYRFNPESFINTWNPARVDVLAVTDSIVRMFAGDSGLRAAAESRRFSANFNMLEEAHANGDTHTAEKCWQAVKKGRRAALLDPSVRAKNKAGAAASYGGRFFVGILFAIKAFFINFASKQGLAHIKLKL